MAIQIRTESEIQQDIIQDLLNSTGLEQSATPGSLANAMVRTFARELANMHRAIDFNFALSFPSKASGIFLDLHAQEVGLTRNTDSLGVTLATENNIIFKAVTGTLQFQLGGNSIPTGTLIESQGSKKQYRTAVDATFDATATEVPVTAVSVSKGIASNVAAGELTVHNLGIPGITVTNNKAITVGTDVEDDQNLRFRITQRADEQEGGTLNSLISSILAIPDIRDVVPVQRSQGVSSATLMVIPRGFELSGITLLTAQIVVATKQAFGSRIRVIGPRSANLELHTLLRFRSNTTDDEKAGTKILAQAIALNFIAGVGLGGTFNLADLNKQILTAADGILDTETLCFRIDGKQLAVGSFQVESDQLLRPSPDSQTPIVFLG